jgi:mannosidase alpha-like ER degradation enhancer 2
LLTWSKKGDSICLALATATDHDENTEQQTTSQRTVWDTLKALQENFQNPQQRRMRPIKRAATKRRALFEYTLTSHYQTKPTESHKLHTASGDSSWGHGPCIFFNEKKTSYWTFQYCSSNNTSQQQQVTQAHWIATSLEGDYRPEVSYNLGNTVYTKESIAEEKVWKDMIHVESFESIEYFGDGDTCLGLAKNDEENGEETSTILKRRTAVIKNPEPQCGPIHLWHEWRIVAVTEPTPCHYIFYVCGPGQENAFEQEELHENKESFTTTTDSAVLQAYLHEADVVDDSIPQDDRTVSWHQALPPLPPSRIEANRNLIKHMFTHAYDSYMHNAFPSPEIQPLTCTPGTFSLVKLPALTLIDALDTLVVMGNMTEFARSVERLRKLAAPHNDTLFAVNQNVSLFETNIRVLGGLLSAHQLANAYIGDSTVLLSDVFAKSGKIRIGGEEKDSDIDSLETNDSNAERIKESNGADIDEEVVLDEHGDDDDDDDDEIIRHDESESQAASVKESIATEEARLDYTTNDDSSTSMREEGEHTCTESNNEECVANDSVCEELAKKKQNATKTSSEAHWSYDGFLLDLAHDLGKRLLPAFDTNTGIPYGTINLLHGIPHGETTVASLAGGGTLSLEMELLSRLTGDESFGKAAKLASRALWLRRSTQHDLLGKHIEITKGHWTESLSGIGSNSDSFYEYLIKHYALFPEDSDFWTMFVAAYNGVYNGTRTGEWYADVDMHLGTKNGASRRVFESLQAFYPGMQVLVGEVGPAARSLNSFFLVREYLGFLPERFNYGSWKVDGGPRGAGLHPLRPELLESNYFLHQATKTGKNSTQSSGWLWAADFALHTLNELTDTPCGYATIKNLSPMTTGVVPPQDNPGIKLENEMPSFFLSETLKYLYLTFDDDNILHQDDEREWIFTTEAHPIHNVPKKRTNAARSVVTEKVDVEDVLDIKMQKVKEMLLERLSKNENSNRNTRGPLSAKTAFLADEKWATGTQLSSHIADIRACDSNIILLKAEMAGPYAFRDYLESKYEENDAYISFGDMGLGDGASLRKSCVNYHSSSFLWIRALNGGVMDYSEVYLSSLSDELFSADDPPIALSAAEALSYHGSGMYLGQYPFPPSCSTSSVVSKKDVSKPHAMPVEQTKGPDVQRFDMGGEEGEFEISAFPEGFMIEKIKTGEMIITTVILDQGKKSGQVGEAAPETNPFVMAYSINPGQSSGSSIDAHLPRKKWSAASLRSFFGRNKHRSSSPQILDRSVIITDSSNSAFRCEVQLFSTVEEENSEVEEELLMVFPCAPALFGPTSLSELSKLGEAQVGGKIRLPDPSDEAGCSEGDSYAPTTVQIVKRGMCTFQSKAINQNLRSGAEAVIIINTEPDELFVMADGGPSVGESASTEIPLTVMVTRNDGEIMSAAIKQGMATTARVQLVPHKVQVNEKGEVLAGVIDWPIVRATKQPLVQVFSENGWGVHGITRPKENQVGQDWQLFLVKHEFNQQHPQQQQQRQQQTEETQL